MIEPFSAATLGKLAFETAKTAITKWVGARIAAGLDTTLRNRQLRQGLPAKDQQTELAAVIRAAVDLTAAELFPDHERLQGKFRKALLAGDTTDWPLVCGSDLTDLVTDVRAWISENNLQPGARGDDPAAHSYLLVLCRNIIAQFGFRAENNGAKNPILSVRWQRFWMTELFNGIREPAPVAEVERASAQPVQRRRFGTLPPVAAAHQNRPVDQQLADALAEDGTVLVCQILSGMGGVGKTQIAAAFAHRQWAQREVDLLLWINASSRKTIITTFAQAASDLCGADASDSDAAARRFLTWLADSETPRWLIVLDDLTNPGDLHDLWPPTSEHGRTIVTTRRRDAALDAHTRNRIDVDLYTPDQALAYLTNRLGSYDRLLTGAADLAKYLDYLPLGLAHAAAFILDQPGQTCVTYQRLLANRISLARLSPDTPPDGYPTPLAAAWSLSIAEANELAPRGLAGNLLALGSVLEPAGFPVSLFGAQHVLIRLFTEVTMFSGEVLLDGLDLEKTLGRLRQLHLIEYEKGIIRIHALTQRAIRDSLEPGDLRNAVRLAAGGLSEIWPDQEANLGYTAMLLANVTRLREHDEAALFQDGAHAVLRQYGNSLQANGVMHDTCHHFEQLHQHCKKKFGPDDRETLLARYELARSQTEADDPIGAIATYEELLTDLLRVEGPDHHDTRAIRHNLAHARGQAGDAARAERELQELLDEYLPIFGPVHPEVLPVRNNHAIWRGVTGDPAGAVSEYQEQLADCQEADFDPDDRQLLLIRNNLAYWLWQADDFEGAISALREFLNDLERHLGPAHHLTFAAQDTLVQFLGESGDATGAAAEAEKLLIDRQRLLGPVHPEVHATRTTLELWQAEADRENEHVPSDPPIRELPKGVLKVFTFPHLQQRHNIRRS